MIGESYQDIFRKKMKNCKSKKDYKRLCKEMIRQFGVIDQVDINQYKIFSQILGEDTYSSGIALAIRMYLLESQGIPCEIVDIVDIEDI